MQPVSVMIARFPFGRCDEPDVTDWLVDTVVRMKGDGRISKILHTRIIDTPITMCRNRVLAEAVEKKVDFLLQVDNDMKPDAYLASNPNRLCIDTTAQRFWDVAFETCLRHRQEDKSPAIVGAPYCGPPPIENVYVFRWATHETDGPQDAADNIKLAAYEREETVHLEGVQEVAALPTGLILLDVEALKLIDPPYTSYQWTDQHERGKASTEDVVLTRDLSLAGATCYCTWSSWAGHWKRKCVGRPMPLVASAVAKKFQDAVLRKYNILPNEELVHVGEENGKDWALPARADA